MNFFWQDTVRGGGVINGGAKIFKFYNLPKKIIIIKKEILKFTSKEVLLLFFFPRRDWAGGGGNFAVGTRISNCQIFQRINQSPHPYPCSYTILPCPLLVFFILFFMSERSLEGGARISILGSSIIKTKRKRRRWQTCIFFFFFPGWNQGAIAPPAPRPPWLYRCHLPSPLKLCHWLGHTKL